MEWFFDGREREFEVCGVDMVYHSEIVMVICAVVCRDSEAPSHPDNSLISSIIPPMIYNFAFTSPLRLSSTSLTASSAIP